MPENNLPDWQPSTPMTTPSKKRKAEASLPTPMATPSKKARATQPTPTTPSKQTAKASQPAAAPMHAGQQPLTPRAPSRGLPPAPSSLPKKPPTAFQTPPQQLPRSEFAFPTPADSPTPKRRRTSKKSTVSSKPVLDQSPSIYTKMPPWKKPTVDSASAIATTEVGPTTTDQPTVNAITATDEQQASEQTPSTYTKMPPWKKSAVDSTSAVPMTKAVPPTTDQPIADPTASDEQQASEQMGKSETTPESNGEDEIWKRIEAKLMRGEDTLTGDEQNALCRTIEGMGEAEEDVLIGVATLVGNLTESLIFRLALWHYRRGNKPLVDKLLKAHLNDVRGAEDELMSVEDVGVLMDCQIAKELLEKEMGLR
ncbi:hypothetical protein SLS62_010206 [Diatrype stigma]|uniref:Uncharacterized protein n=1 Tax=Diatrype stigma TaxID=117547 RepID=A0AAN9UAR6_9PEZI